VGKDASEGRRDGGATLQFIPFDKLIAALRRILQIHIHRPVLGDGGHVRRNFPVDVGGSNFLAWG